MTDGLPPGWTCADGIVAPGERVADFAARGQGVKGVCQSRGCFRKVELDPQALCKGGLAALGMQQLQRLWMCQRLDGCGLDFHNEPMALPLRLDLFVGKPNVRVRLRRRGGGCKFFRIYAVEQMIAGLERRKQGSGRTEVAALGGLMTGGCPACRKTNWGAEVLYVSTETVGWKAVGGRSFAEGPAGYFRS